MNVFFFLFGYCRIYANAQNDLALLNLCMERGYAYTDFLSTEDGGVSFSCSALTARALIRACQARQITVAIEKRGGMPHFLWRYRRRWGMLLGLFIGALLLWLSGRFVWDVRVFGNETMTASEVRSELSACGFGVGSFIPEFEGNELENRVMLRSDRISWISVFMDGTVAMVQIKENAMPPDKEPLRPANLVAACDGQIELLQLYRGNAVVSIGQAVRKGELLVSGLYDSTTQGIRFTRASGEVLARVEDEFHIEIPLSYERKVYEGAEVSRITLDFFDFSLKIFENSRNSEFPCDIIYEEHALSLWGLDDLPMGLAVERALPYRTEAASRTHEEALTLAYEQLEAMLAVHATGAELLQKVITTTVTDTSVILDCAVSCIRDIAVQVEFDVAS